MRLRESLEAVAEVSPEAFENLRRPNVATQSREDQDDQLRAEATEELEMIRFLLIRPASGLGVAGLRRDAQLQWRRRRLPGNHDLTLQAGPNREVHGHFRGRGTERRRPEDGRGKLAG